MQKSIKKILSFVLVIVFIFSVFTIIPATAQEVQASAANQWVKISQQPVKSGSYYYKWESGNVLYSKSKTSGYKKAGFNDSVSTAVTNGKTICAVECKGNGSKYTLASFTISGKKRKTLHSLGSGYGSNKECFWGVVGGYGNTVFIEKEILYHKKVLYKYNISSKKYTMLKDNATFVKQSGANILLSNTSLHEGGTLNPYTLYKSSAAGNLTTIKKLGNKIDHVVLRDKGFYYVKFQDQDRKKATVYYCTMTGSQKKLLTVTANNSAGSKVNVSVINQDETMYITYGMYSSIYCIDLKTKQITERFG